MPYLAFIIFDCSYFVNKAGFLNAHIFPLIFLLD